MANVPIAPRVSAGGLTANSKVRARAMDIVLCWGTSALPADRVLRY
jgi:hypothetical protein